MAVDVSRIPNNNKFDPVREAILQLQTEIEDTGAAIGNGTLTIGTSSPLSGDATFTANQIGNTTITIGIDDSDYVSLSETSLQTLSGSLSLVNATLSGYLRGPSTFVIDPAAHGDDTGTVVIAGNLQVDGTTTTINSTTLTVDDKNIVIASGAADATAANGAGITIDGADATMTYVDADDRFVFNKDIEANLVGNADTATYATSAGDADTLDSLNSTQFLRSDENDSTLGTLDVLGGLFRVTGDVGNTAQIMLSEGGGDDHVIMEYDGTGSGATNYFHIYSGIASWAQKGDSLNIQPSTGRVAIGNTSFDEVLHVTGNVKATTFIGDLTGNNINGTTGNFEDVFLTNASGASLAFRNSQDNTVDTDNLATVSFQGYYDSAFVGASRIQVKANEDFSATARGTVINFDFWDTGSTYDTVASIDSSGLYIGTTNVYDNLPDGITYSDTDNRLKIGVSKNVGGTVETNIQPILLADILTEGYIPYVATGNGGSSQGVNSRVSNSWLQLLTYSSEDTLQLGVYDPLVSLVRPTTQMRLMKGVDMSTYHDMLVKADEIVVTMSATGGGSTASLKFINDAGSPRIGFNGEYKFPATDGTSGQVLTTNGSGDLSWVAAGGPTTSDLQDVTDNGSITDNPIAIASSASNFTAITLETSSTTYVKQDFKTDTIAASTAYIIAYGSTNAQDGSLAIKNNSSHTTTNGTAGDIWFTTGASASDRMRIEGSTGNVRISENLTVNKTINSDGLIIDDVSWNSGKVRIEGASPNIEFRDINSGSYYWQLGGNGQTFYILHDTNKDGSYETTYPLQLDSSDSTGKLYGERIFADNYHPNADRWTTARTIFLGGDLTGSVSIDGSANVTLSAQVVNDSHTHDGRYYTEDEMNRSLARLAGWVPGFSNADETTVYWDKANEAVAIADSPSDNAIGMVYKAIRMKAGDVVRITIAIRGSIADTDGVYLRVGFYAGDLPDGKTHVAAAASYSFVQESTYEPNNWWENNAITTGWQNFEYDFTAPSDGYMSPYVLNWSGYGGILYVKQPNIEFQKVNIANTLDGIDSSQFLRSDADDTATGMITINSTGGGVLRLQNNDTSNVQNQTLGSIVWNNQDGSSTGPNNAAIIEAQTYGSLGQGANLLFKTVSATTEGGDATTSMTLFGDGVASFNNNVGIGDATPDAKLHITTTSGDHLRLAYNDSYYWDIAREAADGRLSFTDNVSGEALTISTSGNVGIGTTSPSYKLDVSGHIRINNGVGNHLYFGTDSANYLAYSGTSGYWRAGTHYFETTSGFKGVWNSLGNLGIGTTSPSAKLQVGGGTSNQQSSVASLSGSSQGLLSTLSLVNQSANLVTDGGVALDFHLNSAYSPTGRITTRTENVSSPTASYMQFFTYLSGLNERMRITSAGNVGIGTTSPSEKLTVAGGISLTGNINFGSSNGDIHLSRGSYITFYENASSDHSISSRNGAFSESDDIRINSYGSVLINLDSNNNNTSSANLSVGRHGASGTISDWLFVVDGETGAGTFKGDVIAFGSPSDISLKENIKPIVGALDKVKRLQGVTFDWKQNDDDILKIKEDYGFIAQEVQEVLPELVRENENGKLSLRDKGIISVLVEAIKEQQKQIDELKAMIK